MTHKTVEEIVQDLVFRFCNRGNVERADGSHYSQTELEEEVREALTTATEEAERRGEERMKRAQKQTDEYFQLRLTTALEQQAREDVERMEGMKVIEECIDICDGYCYTWGCDSSERREKNKTLDTLISHKKQGLKDNK